MSLSQLQACGVNAASITYDSRDILERFGSAHNIEFPLLSDAGSQVIRAFGILNTNIPPDHKMLYGIPWPGDFLIDPNGVVRDKIFLPSYEHRASATEIAMRNFDSDGSGNSVQVGTGTIDATITLSATRCFPGQELGVSIELKIAPGWHIYGQPLPANYQAAELSFSGDIVGEYLIDFPPAQSMTFEALGETLPVYSGTVRATGKLGVRWSPPMPAKFLAPLGKRIEPGPHMIDGLLRFQTCSDSVCEPPESIRFELPLTIEAGVPPAPKK